MKKTIKYIVSCVLLALLNHIILVMLIMSEGGWYAGNGNRVNSILGYITLLFSLSLFHYKVKKDVFILIITSGLIIHSLFMYF